jgi:TrmH family RNA methyltransferase
MAVEAAAISSRKNAKVKQLRAAFSGQTRPSDGLVAIEGDHLIEEALRSGITPKVVFLSERREPPYPLPYGTEVVRLTDEVFASAVDTRSPQGIAALIDPPESHLAQLFDLTTPLILIAVGLQDPGNLGTLIRSAEAFNADIVLTTPGTVSPWNQKALRAAVGSTFRMPIASVTKTDLEDLQRRGVNLLAALGAEGSDILCVQDADLTQACAIMIGNEGAGLAPEWRRFATTRITIPCPGPVESLNAAVAGSLLLYEASRQRGTSSRLAKAPQHIPGSLRRRPTGATR